MIDCRIRQHCGLPSGPFAIICRVGAEVALEIPGNGPGDGRTRPNMVAALFWVRSAYGVKYLCLRSMQPRGRPMNHQRWTILAITFLALIVPARATAEDANVVKGHIRKIDSSAHQLQITTDEGKEFTLSVDARSRLEQQ